MGNLSCVSCRSKDEKRLDKSLSELGLGDFKGASFTEEVLNIAKSKAAGEEDEYVATPQQQPESPPSPKITTNNLGISDFKGANFTSDIKDESLQSPDDDVSLEKTSSNVRFSAHSMRKNSLTELEQIVRQQKIKSRRLTCPKGYGHGDITPSRGVIPASEQQEEEEEEDVELSPAEVTAKVIVDISLYLTTQVIYPAYMRYLKEDKPDEYLTYLEEAERPSTGSPLSASESSNPELEAREHPEAGDQANRPLTEHPG